MPEGILDKLLIRPHLTVVPNNAVQEIEQAYGISFLEQPLLAPLTVKNRALFGISNVSRYARYIPFEVLANIFGDRDKNKQADDDTTAFYDSDLNVCFTKLKNREDKEIQLHENAHALTNLLNHNVFGRDIFDAMIEDGPALIEQNLVIACVDEGISDWVAVDILLQSDDEDTQSLAYQVGGRDYLAYPRSTSEQQLESSFISKSQFSRLEQVNDVFTSALQERGLRKVIKLTSALNDFFLERLAYIDGYFYVHFAMKRLIEHYNMSKSDALLFVIHHVPTSFGDLSRPETFIDKIQQGL